MLASTWLTEKSLASPPAQASTIIPPFHLTPKNGSSSPTGQDEKKESSVQEYVDSLVLSHIGSWRFYRYVGTDQDEAVVPSLYLSTIRGWLLWSELKRRISVSIIFAVAFLGYYQIRKSSVPVLETERKSM